MWPFKCKHPAWYLVVDDDSSEEVLDDQFIKVTHHLYCINCRSKIDISYARIIEDPKFIISHSAKEEKASVEVKS